MGFRYKIKTWQLELGAKYVNQGLPDTSLKNEPQDGGSCHSTSAFCLVRDTY
jgi:hypothetical protein